MKTDTVLLVDAGNSRIKWGLGKSGRITRGAPFCGRSGELAQELDRLWGDLPAPAQVLISNVAGELTGAALNAWITRRWGLSAHIARVAASAHGVHNGYEEPDTLGVDRWIALIAARGACKDPLCVADCGTALTLDAMDAQGRHLGGLIAPGLRLMRQSLDSGAAALRRLPAGRAAVPARNTADAVQGGILQMAAGLIERFVKTMEASFGTVPRLLLTGGDAPTVSAELNIPFQLEPDLILRGLLRMAEGDS